MPWSAHERRSSRSDEERAGPFPWVRTAAPLTALTIGVLATVPWLVFIGWVVWRAVAWTFN